MVYIYSETQLSKASPEIQLIEKRIVFEKELDSGLQTDSEINVYNGFLSQKLESLALESGIFSRFNQDQRLKSGEFEKLYKLWIKKSLEAKEALLPENEAGFVSCSVKEDLAQIGLIAVDKSHRGKGWGKRLIQAAESFAFSKGAKKMRIGTQESNQLACSLYEKLGYEVVERVWVWHYWSSSPPAI